MNKTCNMSQIERRGSRGKCRGGAFVIFGAFLAVLPNVSAAERPNILLILPDQMRASAMGCDGNAEVRTPNIDRLAAEFLKSQPKDLPFFLTVQMGPPHDPYGAPEEYIRQYIPERITPPKNWRPGSETSPVPAGGKKSVGAASNRVVPLGGLEEIAAYYAAITALDDQVGRLMTTLRESGLDENTIVLFTSDHGDMLGSHGLRRKRKPHDESARVPGILRWPARIPKGRVVETLFSHVDMAPTLLALAGLPVPRIMQGTDLSRVALGETTDGPDAVLLQIFVSTSFKDNLT